MNYKIKNKILKNLQSKILKPPNYKQFRKFYSFIA